MKKQEWEKACLTPRELAERWGFHKGSLDNWRVQGIGPAYIKLGRKVLYSIAEIEKWERKHTKKNTAE